MPAGVAPPSNPVAEVCTLVAAHPSHLCWAVEVEAFGFWQPLRSITATLRGAILFASEMRCHHGAARLVAPGFEIVALPDSFSIKCLEATE